MWHVVNTARALEDLRIHHKDLSELLVAGDIPSNLEYIQYPAHNNDTVQVKFYWYNGKYEKTETKVLQGAVAEVGIGSRRLASLSAGNPAAITSGVNELMLGALTAKQEAVYAACLMCLRQAIALPENDGKSSGLAMEKMLSSLDESSVEEMYAVLEVATQLGIKSVTQLKSLVSMFMDTK